MKATLLLLISGTLAWSAAAADLFIESLNRDGRLTWTNSVSNATYRVEWSGSLAGPWNDFNTLTNLNSLAATNIRVSVTVPMFYRVVWTDPPVPQPLGRWLFSGYDSSEMLVATGLVIIASVNTATNPALGSWTLGSSDGTNNSSLLCAAGETAPASVTGIAVSIGLYGCGLAEGAYELVGNMVGNDYTGTWFVEGIVSTPIGRFIARRQSEQSQSGRADNALTARISNVANHRHTP